MLQKFVNAAIAFVVILSAAESLAKQTTTGKINGISSDIIIYDKKVLQLQVNWNDTLPKGTTYNVIVNPMNLTECPDMPCSLYGIPKPSKDIIMPENPMIYVEHMECSYMLGCNYTLTVETSTAMISKTVPFAIPYCLEEICSCQHAWALPAVNAAINITSNRTLDVNWHIELHSLPLQQRQMSNEDFGLVSIYIKISKQTNPSLSWGGQHIPIAENIYPIEQSHYASDTKGLLKGKVRIELTEALPAKTVLFLRTYVIDTLRCDGPEKTVKAEVPVQNVPLAALLEPYDNHMRISLIVVSTLFILVIAGTLSFIMWRRHKAKIDLNNVKEDMLFSLQPFNTPFPGVKDRMVENINYMDTYIADAQSRGIADLFEVPHYAIQLGPEIGEGAFGRVFKAYAINIRGVRGTTVVAVKQLIKNPTADEVGEFLTEIEMLKGVGEHKNIVSFLGCCTLRPPYLMIMEFVGRGDLLSYLRLVREEATRGRDQMGETEPVKYIELQISKDSVYDEMEEVRQTKPSETETTYTIIDGEEPNCAACNCDTFQYILDNKELHYFAVQIANGMRFLEEQQITHRDLAARNVLIDDWKTLKISDFGLSRHGIYTNTKTRKLPLRWLSIEAIRDNLYSNKSDVWAYGVVLWEIGTLGASPYPTISNNELIPFLLSGQRLEKPEICTDEVYDIMQQCWHEDPNVRPNFENLYRILTKKTAYVNINSLSDDYVFPPINL